MKTLALQFMLEGQGRCTIPYFNVHTTVEYLTKNASIGQMQHFKMYCSLYTAKAKNANKKSYNKEVCQASQSLPFINCVSTLLP